MKSAQFQKLVERLDELTPEPREALARSLAADSEMAETTACRCARPQSASAST